MGPRIHRLLKSSVFISLFVTSPLSLAAAKDTEFRFSAGLSEQNFDWSIAGNLEGTSPNVLSELSWKDLLMIQVEADGKFPVGKVASHHPVFLQLGIGYGWIFDGENQDSDFAADNRQLEFSRSNNNAEEGESLQYSAAVGIDFNVTPGFQLSPKIGYGKRELDLTLTDGNQTIDLLTGMTGAFAGLDSTYEAEWWGPFVGLDTRFRYSSNWLWFGGIKYSWDDSYEATADWNLRDDFAHPESFTQATDGQGYDLTLGMTYFFDKQDLSRVSILVSHQEWKGNKGIDKTFFADGSSLSTRLNEVNWDSTSVLLTFTNAY